MKKSILKIFGSLILLVLGIFLGKLLFGQKNSNTTPLPSTIQYRNVGQSNDTTQIANSTTFTGNIIEVKKGGSIQKAVEEAEPGDLIRVFPGTYSENVYIDKDHLSLQGVVIDGKWPTLDGKKEINDAFLYSGNGILIENFQIVNYKGNGIMGQSGATTLLSAITGLLTLVFMAFFHNMA